MIGTIMIQNQKVGFELNYIGDVAYYNFDSNIPLMAYSLNK